MAWVDAAEALRSAIHAHQAERGPLAEALFPVWRGPALRRHADQALAAETELRRRLASAYVVRRLAEPATRAALSSPLEALEAAGVVWNAERDRAAFSGAEAEDVRRGLLAAAEETGRTLDRIRWVVRAALVDRPELLEVVFPRRARTGEAEPASANDPGPAVTTAPESKSGVEPTLTERPMRATGDLAQAKRPRSGAKSPAVPVVQSAPQPAARARATPALSSSSAADSSSDARPVRRKVSTRPAASGPRSRRGRGRARS